MDATLQKLTDFICKLDYADLTPAAIHECKRRFIDSLACAIGGYNAEPCVIARKVAGSAKSDKTA
jgi:2-methylcitrate dehydratase